MSPRQTSTAREPFLENALERWRLAQRLFGELIPSFQDFTDQLESKLSSSSPASPEGHSSPSQELPSQT
jgi:hypothetical protein